MGFNRVCAILLAAGQSTRFGAAKLGYELDFSLPMGVLSAKKLTAAGIDTVVVVSTLTDSLIPHYRSLGAQVVVNKRADEGMSTSIVCGVATHPHYQAWIIALADMPFIQATTYAEMVKYLSQNHAIVAPSFAGRRGHPVGFQQKFKSDLLALSGDKGASSVLEAYSKDLYLFPTQDEGVVQDIDRLEDLPAMIEE